MISLIISGGHSEKDLKHRPGELKDHRSIVWHKKKFVIMPPKGKKKKNPLNDFYFFMQDMKKVLRREGEDWETMDDLVALCHPRWKLLPDHDKARYESAGIIFGNCISTT